MHDSIPPADPSVARAARSRLDRLTKPPQSLGRLEDLAVRLWTINGGPPAHRFERRAVLIAAADHGVADEGVSAFPAEVTAQMVGGFCAGSAAINMLAAVVHAPVYVADFGVRVPSPPHPSLFDLRVAAGTANFARGPAMSLDQAHQALAAGERAFSIVAQREGSLHALALGEMGIANTTSAAALVALFCGVDASLVVGRGTGIDDDRLTRKTRLVEAAVKRSLPLASMERAAEVGGFEIIALAGAMLAAARARVAIVLDGFIVSAAALLARELEPAVVDSMIAAHRSQEAGHRIALDSLGLEPLFDLDLRLGEASGAVLALGWLEAAARMIGDMKTFEEAGVSDAVAPAMS